MVIEREPRGTEKREQYGSGGNKRGNTKGWSEKRPPWWQSHPQASPALSLCVVTVAKKVNKSFRALFELEEHKCVCE